MKAQLIRWKNDKIDLAFPLAEAGTLVGRDPGCLVQMPESQVSKRHARLYLENGSWFVEDLESRNGTRVNGVRIRKTKIFDGDRLGFGSEEFTFTTQDITDPDFAPSHVIDFSAETAEQTLLVKPVTKTDGKTVGTPSGSVRQAKSSQLHPQQPPPTPRPPEAASRVK